MNSSRSRVLVTGGSGRIGSQVVECLLSAGYEVQNLDIASGAGKPGGAQVVIGNTASAGDVYAAISSFRPQAVVHLAAWANANVTAGFRIYADNVGGAFNVLKASSELGVRTVILASTGQVYGLERHSPRYVPIDEHHPVRPVNDYALSKLNIEWLGERVAEETGMTVLSFRIMGARDSQAMKAESMAIAAAPGQDRFLLWTRMSTMDVGRAVACALDARAVPSGVYNIAGSKVLIDAAVSELVATHFSPMPEIREDLSKRPALICTRKAREAFGFSASAIALS